MSGGAKPWKDYGNISASDIQHSVYMECEGCRVMWRGCADVFECPVCGEGTPPWEPASLALDGMPVRPKAHRRDRP